MTEIGRETVRKVAKLARIILSPEEEEEFSRDMKEILRAFGKIAKADTRNVKPSFHPIEISEKLRNDRIESSLPQEEALSNTKNKENGFFRGPRVA